MNKKIQLKDSDLRNAVKKIIKEEFSKAPESQELVDTKNNKKYLYHATPGCYVSSINKYGLGGKIPKVRFWDYEGTPYEKIEQGCFLAADEYVAESYVEASESFEELSDAYEERYGKEMPIVVFRINVDDLDKNLLSVDTNQSVDEDAEPTYFYSGVIPFSKLTMINLW